MRQSGDSCNGRYSVGVLVVVWLLTLWSVANIGPSDAFSIGSSSSSSSRRRSSGGGNHWQYGKPQAQKTTTTALSDTIDATLTESSTSSSTTDAIDSTDTPASASTATSSPLFTVDSSPTGPADGLVHSLTFWSIPGQEDTVPPTVLKVGRMGRLAAGAVELQRGDTVLYATAAYDDDVKDNVDFVPLSVEHSERFSSAGLTSGSFHKRDGRPAEHEILTCRLIDRPLRPLIASGWRHETQLLSWVLSFDGERSCDPLAIVASAAALYLSSVPLTKPVAAVLVGMAADGTFLVNPTLEQMQASRLHLIIAGTADAVLMIEGEADFLPESTFIEAVRFGHAAVVAFCQGIYAFGEAIGIEKDFSTIKPPIEGLQERVNQVMTEQVDAMYAVEGNKQTKGVYMGALYTDVLVALQDEFPNETVAIHAALKKLLCQRMFARAQAHGLRGDGRRTNEIRRLDMQVGLLPRVHGSALFTRGETQALATTTLGDSAMRQKLDTIAGLQEKRFYLQYTFPPSCVGETGRVGMPGRREVGHGNLAERALLQTLPSEKEFPYSIRVESLITESHGSSSMASVCGGCLALMDAGVPIKRTVAGIAMGMLLGDKDGISDENAIVLSDITGTEDALGTMDFKVAGDREGITTFQLDIKCEGLTLETMARALDQAREGRLYLLDAMEKCLDAPRPNLPSTVPKMKTFTIAPDSIGKVIGPGGKQIRAIIEDFSLANMDIGEEGGVQLSGFDTEQLEKAEEFVKALISGAGGGGGANGRRERTERAQYAGPEPVVGENYTGKVKGIHPFGVFVEILPGAEDGSTPGFEGLVHVSELARDRVRNCEGFMKSMGVEEVTVKYLGMDKGKARLSRKAVLEEQLGRLNPNGAIDSNHKSEPTLEAMSTVDATAITQALEGLQDL
jgi:polyribonucleotide nucleotidyltransferase